MSSSWTTVCNFTRNFLSTGWNYTCVITRIFGHLRVRCVDTACNVRAVHALCTCVMLQSLWPVLYFWIKCGPECSIMNFWNLRHIYDKSSWVWLAKQSKHTRLLQAIQEIWQNSVLFRFKQRLHRLWVVATGQYPHVNLPSETVIERLEKSAMNVFDN